MKKLLFALCLCLMSSAVFAVKVASLYQASVPVSSQSAEERSKVMPQALAQVLIKVSGNKQIIANSRIQSLLSSADTLVDEFGYRTKADKSFLLQVDFEQEGVNRLLHEAGVGLWEQNRPLILVWLESEAPSVETEIITADSADGMASLLKENALRRGLPVIFPMMDMTDMNQISVNDIVTMSLPKLTNASLRYASDAILIGRMIKDTNGYNAQFKLVLGKDQWNWNIEKKTRDEALAVMMDNVADAVSGRYAAVVADTVQTTLTLKISGINQSDDFTELMNYLKHLSQVADVNVAQVLGSDVTLNVSLRGSEDSLKQTFTIGQKLTKVSADGQQWSYQWNH